MAITADFTADVTSGASPLTVTFTDTSTDSPTNWLWEFGDGYVSTLQNPTHTYTVDGPYTVKLTAFKSTGSSYVTGTFSSPLIRSSSGVFPTHIAAYNSFDSNSFVSGSLTGNAFFVEFRSGEYSYLAIKNTLNIDLTGKSGIAILELRMSDSIDDPQSSVLLNTGSQLAAANDNLYHAIEDVSSLLGSTGARSITDGNNYDILSPVTNKGGWDIKYFRTNVHSFSNLDSETKVDFINVGVDAPVAEFSANPREGYEGMSVQFSDESTNTPTSWSWKRRPSGTDAPYVEFATTKFPLEDFDIDAP